MANLKKRECVIELAHQFSGSLNPSRDGQAVRYWGNINSRLPPRFKNYSSVLQHLKSSTTTFSCIFPWRFLSTRPSADTCTAKYSWCSNQSDHSRWTYLAFHITLPPTKSISNEQRKTSCGISETQPFQTNSTNLSNLRSNESWHPMSPALTVSRAWQNPSRRRSPGTSDTPSLEATYPTLSHSGIFEWVSHTLTQIFMVWASLQSWNRSWTFQKLWLTPLLGDHETAPQKQNILQSRLPPNKHTKNEITK